MDDPVLILIHAASALVLVGLIWTVQIVHYPLMALIDAERFVAYEAAHAPRMAAVVMLPWTLQGVTTGWMLLSRPPGQPMWALAVAAMTAVIPVAVTIVWSVPTHARLSEGFDIDVHRRLVRTNWLRTWAWTAHGANAAGMILRAG